MVNVVENRAEAADVKECPDWQRWLDSCELSAEQWYDQVEKSMNRRRVFQTRASILVPLRVLQIFLFFLIMPVTAAFASTRQSEPESGYAKVAFQNSSVDLGILNSTGPATCEFLFKNIGTGTLEIREAKASCGCTVLQDWTRQVPPGGVGHIPIRFYPGNAFGKVSKSIQVFSNDPQQPVATLRLEAYVKSSVEISPSRMQMDLFGVGATNALGVVRIINREEQPLILQPPQVPNSDFAAKLVSIENGKSYEVQLRVLRRPVETSAEFPLTIVTSSTNTPLIAIDVVVNNPAVVPFPPDVTVFPNRTDSELYHVTVQNNRESPLALSNPEVNVSGAKVGIQEQLAGQLYRLELCLPKESQTALSPESRIVLRTNHPEQPEVAIPIKVFGAKGAAFPAQTSRPATAPAPNTISREAPSSAKSHSSVPALKSIEPRRPMSKP